MALAQEAKLRGHACAFVMNHGKYYEKIKNDFSVFDSGEYPGWLLWLSAIKNRIAAPKFSSQTVFTEISGLDYQVLRDGLVSEKVIEKRLAGYLKIVEKFKPDLLVGDTNLLVWLLSQRVEIPVVQIVRYASHPRTAELIWWKERPPDLIPPNSTELFNPLLRKLDLAPIEKAEDLLQGNLYVVPSIPDIEPVPVHDDTIHVGELTISNGSKEMPAWLGEIETGNPLVYVTIGGGAGPVGNRDLFSTIVDAFTGKAIQVVVSTSSKFDISDFSVPSKNVRFFSWVPGKLLISKADLVVFHGGYGTMMETISCGKPTLVLPFQSEQEGNGRRLEQLGSGRVVLLSKGKFIVIEKSWGYGKYSYLIKKSYDLKAEELIEEVEEVLDNPEYAGRARYLQSQVKAYQGARMAIETIEKIFS